jgi:hypothetical protein
MPAILSYLFEAQKYNALKLACFCPVFILCEYLYPPTQKKAQKLPLFYNCGVFAL